MRREPRPDPSGQLVAGANTSAPGVAPRRFSTRVACDRPARERTAGTAVRGGMLGVSGLHDISPPRFRGPRGIIGAGPGGRQGARWLIFQEKRVGCRDRGGDEGRSLTQKTGGTSCAPMSPISRCSERQDGGQWDSSKGRTRAWGQRVRVPEVILPKKKQSMAKDQDV